MNGGELVSGVLKQHGVKNVFTLCGGHISPILVGCVKDNIGVIDVRHEVNAVFAADATARLTGTPGVAAVTAGPGLTNTVTAVKNAQLAQSPLVLFGGATATVLRGRGSLQDIDQMALMKPHVKWHRCVTRVRDLIPAVHEAFARSMSGVPGPVFVEVPVDLLYPESIVKEWYLKDSSSASLMQKLEQAYLRRHVNRVFQKAPASVPDLPGSAVAYPRHSERDVEKAAAALEKSQRPVMVIGSQALADAGYATALAQAVEHLGIPVYLAGMARGLLGANHPLQMRHKRRDALRGADLTILAGAPCDFRMNYGRHLNRSAHYIAINRSREDLNKNRRPNHGILGDAGEFLIDLAASSKPRGSWTSWINELRELNDARDQEIAKQAKMRTGKLNPIMVSQHIEQNLADDSILVVDGGDFVATASYVVSPRAPLSWLDPGLFGTLGVGAGFALGAKLARPDSEVWIIYGDGSAAYSLAEFDTFVRHKVPVIAVVGNDACWTQIARDQVEILGDPVATNLEYTDYQDVAKALGGAGANLKSKKDVGRVFKEAKRKARQGVPYLINAHIGSTDFRKGSISI